MRQHFLFVTVYILVNFTFFAYSQQDPAPSPAPVPPTPAPIIVNNNFYLTVEGPSLTARTKSSAANATNAQPETNTVLQASIPEIKPTPHPEPPASSSPENLSMPFAPARSASTPQVIWYQPIVDNKWWCITGTVVTAYSTLFLIYFYYESRINRPSVWSCWRASLPIEELYQMADDQITNDLIASINNKYRKQHGAACTINKFYAFSCELDGELNLLHQYLSFVKFLNRSYLVWIVPSQAALVAKVEEKIKRLEWLRKKSERLLMNLENASTDKK